MARTDRGASAVEFAIILPLLFLVLGGVVDFGRYFFFQIQLANAAREGARVAIVYPVNTADPTSSASASASITSRAVAAIGAVPSATVTPVAICTSGVTGYASVAVSAPFTWSVLGPAMRMVRGSWPSPTAASTGVMRCPG